MKKYLNLFLDYGKIQNYKNNDIIFNENDTCNFFGFIIKGKIKIITSSKDGNEIIINQLSDNQCFGDLLLFSSTPVYYGTGVSLTSTSICFLSKKDLLSIMDKKPDFLESFLKLIANKGIELKQKNKLFAHKNIEDRITFYLYNYHTKDKDNYVHYKSITDLANFLSIPRPSLSRTLHMMERNGKIIIEKNKIRLL